MTTTDQAIRSSGVLLHPTSLPSSFGIGDLGPSAYAWVDALVQAKQTWWQILPIGPTGYGDSPYQCFSAFAGNPYIVSPQHLVEDGLLDPGDCDNGGFPANIVLYGPVIQFKNFLLEKAWQRFQAGRGSVLKPAFEKFCAEESAWLDDYALFMAIKDRHQLRSWLDWETPARMREPAYLQRVRTESASVFGQHRFRQFLFFRQWRQLKSYANERGIKIIGDIPIFVSPDSADVWGSPHLFALDSERKPEMVAGVPPDYFSATGQLWGNPHYDWTAMEKTGFAWWVERFRATTKLVDLVRLDHFRGFQAYWEVPAGSPNAIKGRWVLAPGQRLLEAVKAKLGGLPIIAEDLGVITPEVDALRRAFDLPGMRILQFAFGEGATNRFLPHNYDANTVVYTGTHDNDTTCGWYRAADEVIRDHVRRYLARDGADVAWDFIRAAWSSVAACAIAPLQDILNLGTEARMNFPGKPQGNWSWRLPPSQLNLQCLDRLIELTELYGRGRIEKSVSV
ncbi:MAG: 4-alpha-glucanotransferase [Gemmataceae bacterium]|nr:4-alpha-glucanotransferase [Gemmataceae bacterium]